MQAAGQRLQRLVIRGASTALVAAGHFRNVDQTIPLTVARKFHPMAGFRGGRRFKKGRRSRQTKRGKVRAMHKRSARVARQSHKKIAAEQHIPLAQDIELDLTQNIIGGAGTNMQIWNSITQGIGSGERIGERIRRTGLLVDMRFERDLPQVLETDNKFVRVIWARQKGHGHFPTTAAATGGLPAWPIGTDCFTREWHREYKLVKDVRVYFGIAKGILQTANSRVHKRFKFKFNYPCTFDASGANMDTGRLYMYVTAIDSVPATANDLRVNITTYCSYFVDDLA